MEPIWVGAGHFEGTGVPFGASGPHVFGAVRGPGWQGFCDLFAGSF